MCSRWRAGPARAFSASEKRNSATWTTGLCTEQKYTKKLSLPHGIRTGPSGPFFRQFFGCNHIALQLRGNALGHAGCWLRSRLGAGNCFAGQLAGGTLLLLAGLAGQVVVDREIPAHQGRKTGEVASPHRRQGRLGGFLLLAARGGRPLGGIAGPA